MPKDRNYITDSVIDDELIKRTKKYEICAKYVYRQHWKRDSGLWTDVRER